MCLLLTHTHKHQCVFANRRMARNWSTPNFFSLSYPNWRTARTVVDFILPWVMSPCSDQGSTHNKIQKCTSEIFINLHKIFFSFFFSFKVTRIILFAQSSKIKPNTVRPFSMLKNSITLACCCCCSFYIPVNKIVVVLIRFSACVCVCGFAKMKQPQHNKKKFVQFLYGGNIMIYVHNWKTERERWIASIYCVCFAFFH